MITNFLRRNFAAFGLTGVTMVVLCSLVAGLFYRGPEGESYSLLNHFISELGEVGVSPLARLFNLGLIAGGLSFIPFSLGLGLSLPGRMSKAGLLAGLVAAVSLTGVGLFPMSNLAPASFVAPSALWRHITAAMTYFRSGLATVVLFGLAIQLQPAERAVIGRRVNLASLAAAACYAGFILYPYIFPLPGGSKALDTTGFLRSGRPPVWPLAVMEWAVFFSTILWFAAISAAGRQGH